MSEQKVTAEQVLLEITQWHLKDVKAKGRQAAETEIQRRFHESFGYPIVAVPTDQLPRAIDQLAWIIASRRQVEGATSIDHVEELIEAIVTAASAGLRKTSSSDVTALMTAIRAGRNGQSSGSDVGSSDEQEAWRIVSLVNELLHGPGEVTEGSAMTDQEAYAYAQDRLAGGRYCIVRGWIMIYLDFSPQQREMLAVSNLQPCVLYAHHVVYDSENRWEEGDCVRTSLLHRFTNGFHFNTHNTTYLLLGNGLHKSTPASTLVHMI